MKFKIALAVLLSASFIGFAQVPVLKPDVEYDGYKGPVKKLTEILYEAYGTQAKPEKTLKLESSQIRYERSGKKIDIKYFTGEEELIFRIRHKRDGIGNINLDQAIDPLDSVIGRTYYSFNPANQLVEVITYDQEMQLENRMHVSYDKNGVVSQRSYNDRHNDVRRREIYKYYEDGLLSVSTIYDRTNTKVQEVFFEYDDHGEVTTQTTFDYYDDEEPLVTVQMFSYKYDDYGNWIEKVEFAVEKGEVYPVLIIDRIYEYYK